MNISQFITWFINEFIRIGSNILAKLDAITIYGNVSLMDFIITIAIIGAFIEIMITAPRLHTIERVSRREEKNDK